VFNWSSMPNHKDIQKLLLRMVQLIVDHPEKVAIEAVNEDEDRTTTFRIRVNPRMSERSSADRPETPDLYAFSRAQWG
jgi:hypothetical protein